jgi:glycosyltransferase involved in cell wall biosynthesis
MSDMAPPVVSIVLLSYNQAEFVRDAVESVLAQSFPDWELIVVENGSTDGSQAILQEYARDRRVRLVLHERNEAITRRLNEGIALTRGKYVSLLFSDDYYLPHKLAHQVPMLERLPERVGVVYGPGYQLNVLSGQRWLVDHVSVSGDLLLTLMRICPNGFINPIAPLYRRVCLTGNPFYEDLFQEGEAILLRIALRHHFQYDPEPLVVMRDHARNIGKAVKRNADIFFQLIDRLGADPDFPAALRPELSVLRVRCRRVSAWQVLRVNGDVQWVRTQLLRSIGEDPRQLRHVKTVAGVGWTLLPSPLRRGVNRVLSAITRPQGTTAYVEDYR